MPTYEICRYRNAKFDADAEGWDLGEPAETVREIAAEYPGLARDAANGTVRETAAEWTTRNIRGKRERLPLYLPLADDAGILMAWQTTDGILALVVASSPG